MTISPKIKISDEMIEEAARKSVATEFEPDYYDHMGEAGRAMVRHQAKRWLSVCCKTIGLEIEE